MQNFLYSQHYNWWVQKNFTKSIILIVGSSIVHIIIQLFGLKTTINILHLFTQGFSYSYYLKERTDIKKMKRIIHPSFKKIRKSKYIFANCLSTSIFLHLLLKIQGLDTELMIGVQKNDIFKAHAWIEYKSFPLNDNSRIRKKFSTFEYNFITIKIS